MRGVEDAFQKLIQSISFLKAADPENSIKKIIRTNVSSLNLERLDDVLDIAKSLEINKVDYAIYSVVDSNIIEQTNKVFGEKVASLRSNIPRGLLPDNRMLIKEKRKSLVEKASTFGIKLTQTGFLRFPIDKIIKGIKRDRDFCGEKLFTRCTIDAFGDVFVCEYLRYFLGNVRETPIKDIFEGKRFALFLERYLQNFDRLAICDYCCYNL